MSELQLTVAPSDKRPDTLETYSFTRVQEYPSKELVSNGPIQFTQTKVLHSGNAKVYKGTLSGSAHGGTRESSVICKLILDSTDAREKLLEREATVYSKHLEELQGVCVPRFYGLYVGEIFDEPASCVLLEDCGVALQDLFTEYSVDLRIKSMQALMAIHKRGVIHRDFWPSNVIVDNLTNPTRVNVIDFDTSQIRHTCPFNMKLQLFALPKAMPCLELYEVALDLKLITAATVKYFGTNIKVTSFVGAEGLVRAGPKPRGFTHEQLLQIADNTLAEYFDMYGEFEEYVTGKKKWVIGPML
ncbi:hypothetical protein NM688_g5833 [Phlebia brevispora]|uniref:Uncharacterized protein n=1 Tax=Phlebia brevispora TaxID=194682 RepID=A0ACC1SNZ9_9APHY|nr:hypothetical protein NM688_g5833 [Phlebia brevispora]